MPVMEAAREAQRRAEELTLVVVAVKILEQKRVKAKAINSNLFAIFIHYYIRAKN